MTIKLFDRAKLPSRISSDNEIKQEIQLTKVNSKGKTTGCFWMPAGSHDGFGHKPWRFADVHRVHATHKVESETWLATY